MTGRKITSEKLREGIEIANDKRRALQRLSALRKVTPNEERTDHILDLAKEFKADGVIHYAIQFCTPYTVEAYKVEKAIQKTGIPFLKIETDYGMEDMGQLKARIEAFLEMVKG